MSNLHQITVEQGGGVWDDVPTDAVIPVESKTRGAGKIPQNLIPTAASLINGTSLVGTGNVKFTAGARATNSVEQTLAAIIAEIDLQPGVFGAAGDGSTNDTAALQALIDTTTSGQVIRLRSGKVYIVDGLTLKAYTKLDLNGSVIRASATCTTVLTLVDQGAVQTTEVCIIRNGRIDGNDVSGVTGIYVGSQVALFMDSVTVRKCAIHVYLTSAQFNCFVNCKTVATTATIGTVGYYIKPVVPGGGGNSNTFLHCKAFNCDVGLLANQTGTLPFHSNNFYNFIVTGSKVAQIALFNTSHIVFDGLSNETCGTATASITIDGVTIYNSSIYMYNAKAEIRSVFFSEASVNPCILLENGSRLNGTGHISGYGVSNGQFVKRTDTVSGAYFSGGSGAVGNADLPYGYVGPWGGTVGSMVLPPRTFVTTSFANEASSVNQAPVNTTGVTSTGTATDTLFGTVQQVVFAASVGGSSSNRIRMDFNCAGAVRVHAFNFMSSVDGWFQIGYAGNIGNRDFYTKAGVWRRVFYVNNAVSTGSQTLYIYPKDTAAPTVQFCRWQVASGAEDASTRAMIAAIAAGAYNPKIAVLTENAGAIGGTNDGNLPDISTISASYTQAEVTALRDAVRELAARVNTLSQV